MQQWNTSQHTYEEIRDVVIDILLGKESTTYVADQYEHLVIGVADVFARRRSPNPQPGNYVSQTRAQLHSYDVELVRDVFWDLFRQGFITLGLNSSNTNWPFFRLSHFGQKALESDSPYRFHNTASFLALLHENVPDISQEAVSYLDEAVGTFYAGCNLASCVMLGVAAEAEFLRLVDIASTNSTHGVSFHAVIKERAIRSKITKFLGVLKPILPSLAPKKNFEDIDLNFSLIQSVLRVARNDAGHPTGTAIPEREQVYIFLQLFVPFAVQVARLRDALK